MLYYKRGKRGVIADYKTKHIYKFYKEKVKNSVDRVMFLNILKKFFCGSEDYDGIIKEMILGNIVLRFPVRLGGLYLKKSKRYPTIREDGTLDKKYIPVDWRATLNMWERKYPGLTKEEIKAIPNKKVIHNYNEKTESYAVQFYWDRITSNIPNQFFYKLELNRDHKRLVAKLIKDKPDLIKLYYE